MGSWLRFFGPAGFMPHGFCILWRPDILALQVVSDALIAASYFSIPLAIMVFVRKRRDLEPAQKRVALLFAVFILSCGLTHVMGVVVFWWPAYGLDGLLKAFTAFASIITAATLWLLLPQVLSLPSPRALGLANARLAEEVAARNLAFVEVEAIRASLEGEVEARTREARADAARLAAILETAPDAMVIIDETGVVQSMSVTAERLFGYVAGEVVGRNVKVLMPEPYHGEHDQYLDRYRATGERRIIGVGRIVMGRRKDGGTFPMELAVGEVKLEEGRQFTGFVRDLTAAQHADKRMHELQAELLHVSRHSEMGQMASALAHELNQPLSAASNYIEGARRLIETGSFDRAKVGCELGSQQIGRAGDIIRRMRDFLKKGEASRTTESLPHALEEASALALVGARAQGVSATMNLSAEAPRALMDKVQVQQVVVNLIRNAVEAMIGGSRRELTISTKKAGPNLVEVAVADTGPGLAPEMHGRLFQAFATTKESGMGVGLSLCRTIVEAHGGKIWAEDSPMGGTVFRFTLLADEPVAA